VLKLIEAEKPSPKPGEAPIRLQLRPINPFELSLVRGTYRIKPPLLAAVGFEGGGVVEELGDGASNLRVGIRPNTPDFAPG
jgi:NADPH2:quinone reductase